VGAVLQKRAVHRHCCSPRADSYHPWAAKPPRLSNGLLSGSRPGWRTLLAGGLWGGAAVAGTGGPWELRWRSLQPPNIRAQGSLVAVHSLWLTCGQQPSFRLSGGPCSTSQWLTCGQHPSFRLSGGTLQHLPGASTTGPEARQRHAHLCLAGGGCSAVGGNREQSRLAEGRGLGGAGPCSDRSERRVHARTTRPGEVLRKGAQSPRGAHMLRWRDARQEERGGEGGGGMAV